MVVVAREVLPGHEQVVAVRPQRVQRVDGGVAGGGRVGEHEGRIVLLVAFQRCKIKGEVSRCVCLC